eukprot:TRINITY_DN6936_c0_g1_i1.p1 TRINITY_DN6936_c0_g1~~TRINITY_DN6936_c0_g1_i1.p1  ORF type:complete len:320 (+),score=69.99 TRINITY_DN6936_c0_g1_i1:52-960(+)
MDVLIYNYKCLFSNENLLTNSHESTGHIFSLLSLLMQSSGDFIRCQYYLDHAASSSGNFSNTPLNESESGRNVLCLQSTLSKSRLEAFIRNDMVIRMSPLSATEIVWRVYARTFLHFKFGLFMEEFRFLRPNSLFRTTLEEFEELEMLLEAVQNSLSQKQQNFSKLLLWSARAELLVVGQKQSESSQELALKALQLFVSNKDWLQTTGLSLVALFLLVRALHENRRLDLASQPISFLINMSTTFGLAQTLLNEVELFSSVDQITTSWSLSNRQESLKNGAQQSIETLKNSISACISPQQSVV